MKKHRPYTLDQYKSSWKKDFNKLKRKLLFILKENALKVYHIGSTSIPGIISKPQIDILVVVKNLDSIKKYYSPMIKQGFTPLGNYVGNGEECFAMDLPNGKRKATIHIVPKGHDEIKNQLNFRNYLRANPIERDKYSRLKERLYKKYSDNYPAYGKGKKEFIKKTLDKANLWAKNNLKNKQIRQ